jgi:predicted P-loop ATPase
VYLILSNDPSWEGVLGFNEFSLRVEKLRPPPYPGGELGDWSDYDDSRTNIWLTQCYSMLTSSGRVGEAVETVARGNLFHPVRDWLDNLPTWDGIERLDHWLTDCLRVADSEYVRRVARFFIIGMVARIYRPGCKMDNCLVLEGTQGKGKSTALKILGGEWFDDTDINLESKDAMASLQGVWLHEFAELGSLAKAEASKQKSFLSRSEDKYRPPYGTRDIRAKRQTVFGGSVNDWEWQKDPTGGRRFWPVECAEDLNLDLLRENRSAIFAEALAAFKAGERWYPTQEEQKRLFDPEQLQREAPNNYIDALHDWVYEQLADFSMATAIMKGLGLDASKMTTALNTSVGVALKKLGCSRVERRNGMTRYWYRPPNYREPVTGASYVSEEEADHVPL